MTEPEFIHNMREHYQKTPHQFRTTVLVVSAFIVICFLSALLWPNTEDSSWYPNQYITSSKVMALRHPDPDFNDPNFLRDFREIMGFDFHNDEHITNKSLPSKSNRKNWIFWPWRRQP